MTRDHPGQLWLFEDGSMRRVIVCGPRPDPDELGAVLLERAVAVAHKLALPAEQREEIAAEVIVRALPWAQRWRGGGPKTLRAYVGGCCRQALIHILREQRRAKEIHVDGAAIDSRHDPRHVRERLDALDAPGRAPLDAIA